MREIFHWKLAATVAACLFFLAGCNLFVSPESLIRLPNQAKVNNQEEDLISIAKRNLPKGTELTVPNGPVGVEPVISLDIDGDERDEALVLYRSIIHQNQVGAYLLKEGKNGWGKVFATKGTGSEISWASASDITGDGKMEILLGWQIGGSEVKVLEIYQWENDKLTIINDLSYHELEVIHFENDPKARLALWKRDMADAYKIDLLVWSRNTFISDKDHYPSYFQKAISYYEQRTLEVPDAAYYWYYLADSHLKANHPEQALDAINIGMKLKSVVPTKITFEQLKVKIENRQEELKNTDVAFELVDPDVTISVPRSLAPYFSINNELVQDNHLSIAVEVSPDQKMKQLLFTVEVFPIDMVVDNPDSKMEKIGEDLEHQFFVRRAEIASKNPNRTIQFAVNMMDLIISNIELGPLNTKYQSLEDEVVLQRVKEAVKKYWYVMSGGDMPEGKIKTVSINNYDYRYLGSDLNTNAKLMNYLSESFTVNAIDSFKEKAQIFEYFDKLIQPNADGGSYLNYEFGEIVQKKDKGNEKEFDIKIPLGSSFSYEFVHISFQKTENGWRIFSEPGTF
jgi:hypothetical protein